MIKRLQRSLDHSYFITLSLYVLIIILISAHSFVFKLRQAISIERGNIQHLSWMNDAKESLFRKRRKNHHQHNNVVMLSKDDDEEESFQIRDWRTSDGANIYALLTSAEIPGNFNPEGPLDMDVGSEVVIKESYPEEDGACLLVATDKTDDTQILGTAALIVGTPITYYKSGASLSAPEKITGAVRRVCTTAMDEESQEERILECLLIEIELKARKAGTTELILLAYPEGTARRKPTAPLLEALGYSEVLPNTLEGVDAVQYYKSLSS